MEKLRAQFHKLPAVALLVGSCRVGQSAIAQDCPDSQNSPTPRQLPVRDSDDPNSAKVVGMLDADSGMIRVSAIEPA